jgi:transposase
MQQEKMLEKRDEDYKLLQSKFTPLNDRVDKLIVALEELRDENAGLRKELKQKDQQLQELDLLKYQIQQMQRVVYRSTSEKLDASQLALGIDAEVVEACSINDGKRIPEHTRHKAEPKKHPGRNDIPAHIPRVFVDIYPEDVPEGAVLVETIKSEQMEYDPGKLFATCYRRFKYMLKKEDGTVEFFIAPLPEEKDKSIAAPSLKAHVTIEKYMWHTPIYRQRQKFASNGIIIDENTIGDWIGNVCRSLIALYDELRKSIVNPACGYMMADETHMKVLDSDKRKGKKAHIGYMFSYCNPVDRLVFFEYQRGRGIKHAREVLANYQGQKLHSDGYSLYKHYARLRNLIQACCNAHARRKFDLARFTDKKRAEHALMLYAQLYGVEKYCKEMNLSFDERYRLRQEKSVPVFNELAAWVKQEITKVTTLRSPIGKALNYFAEREKELSVFLSDGMVEIDTNLIENTIRPIALGRNNYLFAGSHEAAQNAAIIYSLIATCKLHDVNPYEWLKYVLTAMPTHPASRIRELLPQNWNQVIAES